MSSVTQARPRPIAEVAASLGLADEELAPYGREIAKVSVRALGARRDASVRQAGGRLLHHPHAAG